MDQPATSRFDGENQNFGLVDIHDDLWPALTDRCRDGDPTCDTDAVLGQCTIEIQPCTVINDPRLACVHEAPTTDVVRYPFATSNQELATGLQSSLDTLTAPAARPVACGPSVAVVLPLGGRSTRRATFRTRVGAAARIDADTVRLRCSAR